MNILRAASNRAYSVVLKGGRRLINGEEDADSAVTGSPDSGSLSRMKYSLPSGWMQADHCGGIYIGLNDKVESEKFHLLMI